MASGTKLNHAYPNERERPEFTKWWNEWYNPSDAMGDPREFAFAVWLNARSRRTPNAFEHNEV